MRTLSIVGSTGSVGKSALDVIGRHIERFRVVALGGGSNLEELALQVERFRPELVSSTRADAAAYLRDRLGTGCPDVRTGTEGAVAVATHPAADTLVSAIVGAAGVLPTYGAVEAGKTVALANKESLVACGELMVRTAERTGARIIPIDSEHNALHQCLRGASPAEVRRLILTASGGPFRGMGPSEIADVSPEQALRHPTWSMGRKISIDSATLMNKGLEVIEARWLFGVPGERIDVLIHPQSIVHSIVEFVDGSMLAQLGPTDMRLPIQYALTYPERLETSLPPLDLASIGRLEFSQPDRSTFPCLDLGYRALEAGGSAPAILNAANEVAVDAFLERRIAFSGIPSVIKETLDRCDVGGVGTVEELLDVDRSAREVAARATRKTTVRT